MATQAELDKKTGRSTKTSTATVRRGGSQSRLDTQNIESKARQQETRRSRIHDINTSVRQDHNKEGTDERIQNNGIDVIENPLSDTSSGGVPSGYEEVLRDYVKDDNTAGQEWYLTKAV
jgi:hypothetical protein